MMVDSPCAPEARHQQFCLKSELVEVERPSVPLPSLLQLWRQTAAACPEAHGDGAGTRGMRREG